MNDFFFQRIPEMLAFLERSMAAEEQWIDELKHRMDGVGQMKDLLHELVRQARNKIEIMEALRQQLLQMLEFSQMADAAPGHASSFGFPQINDSLWDDDLLSDELFAPDPPVAEPEPPKAPELAMDKVEFSAISAKSVRSDDYAMIDVVMYEEAYRGVVDQLLAQADEPTRETRSGVMAVSAGTMVQVVLSSPDVEITDAVESGAWHGKYLQFSFAVPIPADISKRRILFVAAVYFNGVLATRLKFLAVCASGRQRMGVERRDIASAFISYASQDRSRVAAVVQGMKKARPDLDIFFDVESLRSGQDWGAALSREIASRDVLYLCWSHFARDSEWVNREWRYAMSLKGAEGIEPIPIEPPSQCPPPRELAHKHFNDMLLYVIRASEQGR